MSDQETRIRNADDADELTCPITFQLFYDPVRASDGHTYERSAITQWIEHNGTSPFTRQPLRIEDLQADDSLRRRAALRRNSTVSYDARKQQVRLLSFRCGLAEASAATDRNFTSTQTPAPPEQGNPEARSCKGCLRIRKRFICVGIVIAAVIALGLGLGLGLLLGRGNCQYTQHYFSKLLVQILNFCLYELCSSFY